MAPTPSYEELMAREAPAMVAVSGADHSSYTGYVDGLMLPESMTYARPGGVIDYTYDTSQALRGLVAGETGTANLDALWEMASNNALLLSPQGRDYPDAPPLSFDPADLSSHPAHPFADAYADVVKGPYAQALGLDPAVVEAVAAHEVSVELKAPRTDGAHALAAYIAEQTGSTPGEVLRKINVQTPGGCLREAARQLAGAAGVPPEREEPLPNGMREARAGLEDLLHEEFPSYTPTEGPAVNPPSLDEIVTQLNTSPDSRPLPPMEPGWTAEGMLDRVKEAVGTWRERLGAPAGRDDDASHAVALGNASASFGSVRAPAPGGLGERAGSGGQPTSPDTWRGRE